jgi:hypothetical protein
MADDGGREERMINGNGAQNNEYIKSRAAFSVACQRRKLQPHTGEEPVSK